MLGSLKGLTAAEAFKYGLVSRVVAQDRVLDEAMSIAERIAKQSTPAIIKAKKCVNLAFEKGLISDRLISTLFPGLTEALKQEIEEFWSCFGLVDSKEGIKAFFEHRKPKYKDK